MAVATYKVYSRMGDELGSTDTAQKHLEELKVDYLAKAFKSFDVDESGFIDPHELRAALTMLGIRSTSIPGVDDVDGDGTLSMKDLDKDGDNKVSFEEFKVLAAVLPKRDHAIYKGALHQKPVTLHPDPDKNTPVQLARASAQEKTNEALNAAMRRLCHKLGVREVKRLKNDTYLRKKFDELDTSQDGRVTWGELEAVIPTSRPPHPALPCVRRPWV